MRGFIIGRLGGLIGMTVLIGALIGPTSGTLTAQPATGNPPPWGPLKQRFDAAWNAAGNSADRAKAIRDHFRSLQNPEGVDVLLDLLARHAGQPEIEVAAFDCFVSTTTNPVIDAMADRISRGRNVETVLGFALGRIASNGMDAGRHATQKLIGLTTDRKREAQIAALHGLKAGGERGGPDALHAVIEALNNTRNRPEVRLAAASALATVGKIDLHRSVPALIAFANERRQRDDAIRQTIATLREMTGYDLGDAVAKWQEWWDVAKTRQNMNPAETGVAMPPPRYVPTYFGIPLTKMNLVFVIDTSGSMADPVDPAMRRRMEALVTPDPTRPEQGPQRRPLPWDRIRTKLDLAREELKRCIDELPEDAHIALVSYATNPTPHNPYQLRRAEPRVKNDISRILDGLRPGTTADTAFTNIYGALVEAFKYSLDGDRRNGVITGDVLPQGATAICFLTDGYPTWSDDSDLNGNKRPDADELTGPGMTGAGKGPHVQANTIIRSIDTLNAHRSAQIHTIGIGEHHRILMSTLAARSTGTYRNLTE